MPQYREGFSRLPNGEDSDHRESDDDSEKALLSSFPNSSSSFLHKFTGHDRVWRWSSISPCGILLTVLNSVIFGISILFFVSPLSREICSSRISDQDHYKATSFYSPILDRFDIPKISVQSNGSLYDTYPPSILRIPTGDDADAEWDRIGTRVFPVILSTEEVIKLGKDPSLAVKIPEKFGYGSDAFIAQTEVFHQLHCIDMLRKEISYEHYYYPKFGNKPDTQHKAHISHCIDLVAQSIKCASSVDMIMFNWVEGWDQPFPDFSNKHQCRDFETLLESVNQNSVPVDVFQAMKEPPEGYVRLPEPGPATPSGS